MHISENIGTIFQPSNSTIGEETLGQSICCYSATDSSLAHISCAYCAQFSAQFHHPPNFQYGGCKTGNTQISTLFI
jgi:hypothetical protein